MNLTANKNNKASLMDDEEIVDKKADKHNPSQSRFVVPAAGIFLT